MGPIDVVNLSLAEIGQRVRISSFADGTPASSAAALFYTPKTQMILRSAPWDFARAQVTLSQLKAQVVNGVVSASPPPQPWAYEYARPSDMLRARFLLPTLQTNPPGTPLTTAPNATINTPSPPIGIPFVVATDYDATNNPIAVILTNLYQAQLVYTRDLSQVPDLWEPLFLAAMTATLGSFFIDALARDAAQSKGQAEKARDIIVQARAANASESISSIDHTPDWMQTRMGSAPAWAWQTGPGGNGSMAGWDTCTVGGLFF